MHIRVSRSTCPNTCMYSIPNDVLTEISQAKCVGATISNDFLWDTNTSAIARKASVACHGSGSTIHVQSPSRATHTAGGIERHTSASVSKCYLNLICHNISYCPKETKAIAYNSLVCSTLDYCGAVRYPTFRKRLINWNASTAGLLALPQTGWEPTINVVTSPPWCATSSGPPSKLDGNTIAWQISTKWQTDSRQYHLPASFPQTTGPIQATTRISALSPPPIHSNKKKPSGTPSQQTSWRVPHWTPSKPLQPIRASHNTCYHLHWWDAPFPGDLPTIQPEPEPELDSHNTYLVP